MNIDKVITLLEKLDTVLDAEQESLMTPGLKGLDALLEEKQELLSRLAENEDFLVSVLEQSPTDSKVATLFDLLKNCRRRNEENNALTVQGMKNIDRSIAYMRSLMQTNSSMTYDTMGKTGSGVDKRNLGLA